MKRAVVLTLLFAVAATGGWFLRDWMDTKYKLPGWVPAAAVQAPAAPVPATDTSGALTPEQQEQAAFDKDLNRQMRIEALQAEHEARVEERKARRQEMREKHEKRVEERRQRQATAAERDQQLHDEIYSGPLPGDPELQEQRTRPGRPPKIKKKPKTQD